MATPIAYVKQIYHIPSGELPPETPFTLHYIIKNNGVGGTIWFKLTKLLPTPSILREEDVYYAEGAEIGFAHPDALPETNEYLVEAGHYDNGTPILDDTGTHIVPIEGFLPEICSWIDAQGGPSALSIEDIFVIIDSYLYETPPSGYTFIPTVQNVFGVIDYYLGFNGDAGTGCSFWANSLSF